MERTRRTLAAETLGVRRRVVMTASMLLALMVIGTLGFKFFSPDATWLDCLYMTATTMTTVGYGEIVPLGPGGRIFVIFFLAVGLGVVSYSAFTFGQFLFSNDIQRLLEQRRMERRIADLKNHYIVCGLGRMGETICQHLEQRNRDFVVVDSNVERMDDRAKRGWLRVQGDATDDGVLVEAGIDRARALATVLPTDADNIYVVLSARLLSSRIEIVSRASDEAAAAKMERAGANRVVSPYSTGAIKMALFMLNPNIEDFLEITDQRGKGQDMELADVQIDESSRYVGKRLMETDLRELGVIVVGIRRRGGERLLPPPGNAMIEAGDCLFAFGSTAAVNRMIGTSGQED
jgi:voltage-gated potassium channel